MSFFARQSSTQSNDKSPIVLYSHSGDWKPYFAYFAGLGQFVFWLSLADMSWRELAPGGKGIPSTDGSISNPKEPYDLHFLYWYMDRAHKPVFKKNA
jgi:hypothetical protein